jgi:hypothetical protein
MHEENYASRREALEREKFLKTGVGRKWLDGMFPQHQKSNK